MKPAVVFGSRAPGHASSHGAHGAHGAQGRDKATVSWASETCRAPRKGPSSSRRQCRSFGIARSGAVTAVAGGICAAASPAPTFKLGKFVDENFIPLALLAAASFGYDDCF